MTNKRDIDKEFFKKWSKDMAYVLGFMFADGNIIRTKNGGYYFSIYTADKDLLFKMRRVMRSNHKISNRKSVSGHNYRIQIGSKEMYKDLEKLGFKENKTHRMVLPKIPNKYFSDFLRGYFDGDGNVWSGLIHKNRKTKHSTIRSVFTSCSESFLKDLQHKIYNISKIKGSISRGKGNFSRLTYSMNGSFKIYNIMYNDSHSILFLDRKRKVFRKFIKMRE